MPLEKSERVYLRHLANEGLMVSDDTCNVHAGMLSDELDHVEKLSRPYAVENKLKDVSSRQRQIERILGEGKCEELRQQAMSPT